MTTILPAAHTIEAIIPLYTAQGDTTLILTSAGGELHYPVKIASVMNALAKREGISLPSLQQTAARLLSHPAHLPLRFSDHLLLTPLKMRVPRLKGDRSYGYVNYFAFHDAAADGLNTLLETTGGHLITILWRHQTTLLHINNAYILDLALRQSAPLLRLLLPLIGSVCGLRLSGSLK